MPSDKRQRKRENTLARQQAVAAAERQAKRRRRIALVLGLALLFGAAIFWATQGDDDDTDVAASGTTTTLVPRKGKADECPPSEGTKRRYTSFDKAPIMCIDPAKKYSAEIETDIGDIAFDLRPDVAPQTVNNFVFLARNRYYDGIIFHRVIPDFMNQTGDPQGDGTGGPGYTIPDEFSADHKFEVGDVAMAKTAAPNSGGSQFFIVTGAQGEALPPEYTWFGKVTKGLSVVQKINEDGSGAGKPNVEHRMISVTVTEE